MKKKNISIQLENLKLGFDWSTEKHDIPGFDKAWEVVKLTTTLDKEIAKLSITMSGRVLKIEDMQVDEKFREKHLALHLMNLALQKYPETEIIQVNVLAQTNKEVLEFYLNQGYSPEEAVKQTPAYKIRARLGFTEIVPGSILSGKHNGFQVRRPTPISF